MFSSIILFGSFFLFLALGVPIAFVLIVATVSYALLSTGDANLALVPQRIIYGINSFRWTYQGWSGDGRHPGMYDVWYSFRLGGSWYGGSWMPDDSGNEG